MNAFVLLSADMCLSHMSELKCNQDLRRIFQICTSVRAPACTAFITLPLARSAWTP